MNSTIFNMLNNVKGIKIANKSLNVVNQHL